MNAVIDVPADVFDATLDFWTGVSGSRAGEVHPEHDEFTVLHPPVGDSVLEVQRIDDGPAGVHLDVFVADVDAAAREAIDLGATVIRHTGIAVLATPAGFVFCVVPHRGEGTVAPLIEAETRPHAIDQLCVDVPHDLFHADVRFWSALTGWTVNEQREPVMEFRSFAQPPELPLRLLIQQLGSDDNGGARSHLDISARGHVAELSQNHIDHHGAILGEAHEFWTALTDPAGLPYCVTSRRPDRGDVAG